MSEINCLTVHSAKIVYLVCVVINPKSTAVTGNVPIAQLFEGEPDHLIPSVSDELLDNKMFAVAGRMIGLSFLHCGPSFPGLSAAIIHILFGGSLETAPVTLQDCPDLDIRDAIIKVNISRPYFLIYGSLCMKVILKQQPRICFHMKNFKFCFFFLFFS